MKDSHLISQRHLEDYYAYQQDEQQTDQHPIMTGALLFILGVLVVASVGVYAARCYRKQFRRKAEPSIMAIELEEKSSTSTPLHQQLQEQPNNAPAWTNSAPQGGGYVDMGGMQGGGP
jgi:cytochrome c-type biogenesis protein CcmH/NrfG